MERNLKEMNDAELVELQAAIFAERESRKKSQPSYSEMCSTSNTDEPLRAARVVEPEADCPRCKVPMQYARFDGRPMFYCHTCRQWELPNAGMIAHGGSIIGW